MALGVVDAKVWARDPLEFDKDADQKRAERRAKPIEDKESIRWVEGYRAACQVAKRAPETLVVSLADSEGDVYEYILEAQTVAGTSQGLVPHSRLSESRLGAAPKRPRPRTRSSIFGSSVASTPVLAQRTLKIRRRDAQSTDGSQAQASARGPHGRGRHPRRG